MGCGVLERHLEMAQIAEWSLHSTFEHLFAALWVHASVLFMKVSEKMKYIYLNKKHIFHIFRSGKIRASSVIFTPSWTTRRRRCAPFPRNWTPSRTNSWPSQRERIAARTTCGVTSACCRFTPCKLFVNQCGWCRRPPLEGGFLGP